MHLVAIRAFKFSQSNYIELWDMRYVVFTNLVAIGAICTQRGATQPLSSFVPGVFSHFGSFHSSSSFPCFICHRI